MKPKVRKGLTVQPLTAGVVLLGFLSPLEAGAPASGPTPPTGLPPAEKVKTVVIDPGHGGKDPGCHGAFVHEKDVALGIALALGKLIETHYPDVRVVYTRKTDVFVELYNRARIANEAHGDLFICIHCNAGHPEAHGSETYALGLHRAATNLAVAKRENEAILLEDNYKENYQGFDVNSPEGSIIFSLIQNTFLHRSLQFAAKCQKYFHTVAGRYDRGVKQAGFLVLVYTAMPSVLIETGFLTNRHEETFLMDPHNQARMAEAIFRAFAEYKSEIEGTAPLGDHNQISTNQLPESPRGASWEVAKEGKNENLEAEKKQPSPPLPDPFSAQETFLTVQFSALPGKRSQMPAPFLMLPEVFTYYENNLTKYCSGKFTSLQEADKRRQALISRGFKDAFLVAFSQGQKVPVQMALAQLQQKD
ncbi:MAG: N-acetylmuramoyl-L-alanine amidase [Flavobacteriales bacterium]|nr:N-acetylmuramoyl-L-alanine amidase [Flavobacteriales bacterium]MCX7768918.1 N-acetylmuramoyl-L-alanine amidase [Flavobacteriales bacterium]MDW8409959.1 N-acetylmuramoyl-L-alanine amidase [Flavobacteriales bacterium]